MRSRWLIVALRLGLLAGCEALKPPPEPESRSEPGVLDMPSREGLETPRASARKRSPSRWLEVEWPPALRLIESGVAGPSERPVRLQPGATVSLGGFELRFLDGDGLEG